VARTYLNRARKEQDTIKMARGYDRLARIFHPQKNIQFADSIIYLTNNIKNITYPGLGYMIKGYEYERIGDLKLATQNYMLNYSLGIKNKNVQHQLYASHKLIIFKSIWGDKNEALRLQKKRHEFISNKKYKEEIKKASRDKSKKNINELYLADEISSFQNFIFCYLNSKKIDSAKYYFKKGLSKTSLYNGNRKYDYDIYFKEISIELEFYSGNYQKAINIGNELLTTLDPEKNCMNIQNIHLFIGLSLKELNNNKDGIKNLKKSDSIFDIYNLTIKHPYQRILYEKLLDYYKNQDNTKKRLEYLNKLIIADSIIKKNYQFFEPTLIKEFEYPELFKEKEELIEELKFDNIKSKSIIWIVLGVLSTCILILIIYYKRQRTYKVRYKELMNRSNTVNTKESTCQLKVPTEIFDDIMNKLETFERKKGYLKSDITINQLAKTFGTNHKYLSKVINIEKDNNFSQYLNDLRITYAFTELQTNDKLRNFTIIAIAKESGFKNAESFSKAFYKKYKIKPSFYLKQLSRGVNFI
jgi:AraC-like DNA-binding protein